MRRAQVGGDEVSVERSDEVVGAYYCTDFESVRKSLLDRYLHHLQLRWSARLVCSWEGRLSYPSRFCGTFCP
jgi:hypothetical protein